MFFRARQEILEAEAGTPYERTSGDVIDLQGGFEPARQPCRA